MSNYIICSNSSRLIDKKISELVNLTDETIHFDLLFNDITEVLEEASYTSLFNDKKNIIVMNANSLVSDKMNSNDKSNLINYLNNPNLNSNIIFVTTEKITKGNECLDIFKKNNNVYDLLKEKTNINDVITNYCKEHKFTINKQAITYLKNNLSNNCDMILNELDKLFMYYDKPTEIEEDVVKRNCSNMIDENNFKFVDLVISKNITESFKYLKELQIIKVDPLSLFSLLVREYRLLIKYKIIENSNNNYSDFIKSYNLKDWQFEKIGRNACNFKMGELKRILKLLSKYDYEYKSGKIEKNNFLDLLLLEIFEY